MSDEQLDAAQVADWLRRNPDFFEQQAELLEQLRLPHASGSAVSLVQRQVSVLRSRNDEARQRLAQLMDVARDNDRLFDKSRRLILDILDANTLEELVGAVEDSLRHDFQVPFVSLILFSDSPLGVGRNLTLVEAQQLAGGLISGGKPLCGSLRPHELEFLFGDKAPGVASAAVATLSHQGIHGLLALGSSDPQHYRSSFGTLFLSHLAEVLARVLPRHGSMPRRALR